MSRRHVLFAGASLVLAPLARVGLAQMPKRQFRVAILWATDEVAVKRLEAAFLAGLRDLGYVSGKNLVVDIRHARGDNSRVVSLADELIALKPDVLVGIEGVAVVIRSKTSTIPIVVIAGPDPVAAGLVQSASRPGTNVTGNAFRQDELIAKQIEVLTEVVPKISRIAVLQHDPAPGEPGGDVAARYAQFATKAAAAKNLALTMVAARDAASLRQAFAALEQARPQGLVVTTGGFLYQFRQDIIDAARRLRLPSISALPPGWLDAGGLLNYGPDFLKYYRYAATFVDRIFRGANPAEIPIEYPATFELGVNLKTARQIGVTIPRAVVLRADRILE